MTGDVLHSAGPDDLSRSPVSGHVLRSAVSSAVLRSAVSGDMLRSAVSSTVLRSPVVGHVLRLFQAQSCDAPPNQRLVHKPLLEAGDLKPEMRSPKEEQELKKSERIRISCEVLCARDITRC